MLVRGVDHKSTRTAKAYWGAGFGPLTNLTTHHLGKVGLLYSSVVWAEPKSVTNAFLFFLHPPKLQKSCFWLAIAPAQTTVLLFVLISSNENECNTKRSCSSSPISFSLFDLNYVLHRVIGVKRKKSKKVCPLEKTKMTGCDFFGSLYSKLK